MTYESEPHEYTLKEVQAFCDRVRGKLRIGLAEPDEQRRAYLTQSKPPRAWVVAVDFEGGRRRALATGDSMDEAFARVVDRINEERSGR